MHSLAIIITILFARRTPKVDGAHLVARFPPALLKRKQSLPLLLPISLLCKQTINLLLSPPSFSFLLLPAPRRPPRGTLWDRIVAVCLLSMSLMFVHTPTPTSFSNYHWATFGHCLTFGFNAILTLGFKLEIIIKGHHGWWWWRTDDNYLKDPWLSELTEQTTYQIMNWWQSP